jgi:hypothetical protein
MKHKSLKLSGLILVLCFTTACSVLGGSGDEEPTPTEEPASSEDGSIITNEEMPVTGSGLCANAYYPVVDGATWSY